MARHSIDRTMLAARDARSDAPVTVRVAIDNPYVDAKSLLLQVVAQHCGARAVRHPSYGFSSVVGFRADVIATEILFTSLLHQSDAELRAASNELTGARQRRYRRAFLLAYADRIGERLATIHRGVVDTYDVLRATDLVPLLASRRELVDRAVDELLGPLATTRSRTMGDATGWVSGRLAADRARLSGGSPDVG